MPQSVIQTLNGMAAREGKKITHTKLHVFDELLYAHSLDKSKMPHFITNPPTQDAIVARTTGGIPANNQPDPTLTDLPAADSVSEVPHSDVGGGVAAGAVHGALGEIQNVELESTGGTPPSPPPTTDVLTHAPQEDLLTLGDDEQPEASTAVEREQIAAAARVMESFRTGDGAFVTEIRSVPVKPASAAASTHSVDEVMKRHRIEMSKGDTANISVKEAFRTRGEDAKRVILSELQQMLDKRVWVPVMGSKLTAMERSAIIRSSMFLKKKNNPDGSFLKLKARLVAGGDQQDKGLYEDLSSPTVSTSGVFTLLAVAAHEKRHVAVVDISGAYLNADMTLGVPVHMRLDRTMTGMITGIDPGYTKYIDARGGVTVHLKKALYGCVESSGLWYENLRATLAGLGYARNVCDKCVFNRVDRDGHQCTVAVHVDDLLIMSKSRDTVTQLANGLHARGQSDRRGRAPLRLRQHRPGGTGQRQGWQADAHPAGPAPGASHPGRTRPHRGVDRHPHLARRPRAHRSAFHCGGTVQPHGGGGVGAAHQPDARHAQSAAPQRQPPQSGGSPVRDRSRVRPAPSPPGDTLRA